MPDASFAILSDDDLHVAVRRLTARSNVVLADLLAHLGEVEARGIHRNKACASLYTYCVYELRMSEDAAFRRSKAARVVHQHPELRGVVARGELHLTGLLMIAPYLGGERHAEVLTRARFRSKREVARLVAEFDPKPEVRARIEPIAPAMARLPARAIAEAFVGPVRDLPSGDRPADWIEPSARDQVAAANDREAADEAGGAPDVATQELAEAGRALQDAWLGKPAAPSDRPLRFRVQFTASQEFVDLFEEAVDLLGFTKKATSLPEVQLRALRELVERLRKQKRGAPARKTTAPARVWGTTENAAMQSTAPARVAGTIEPAEVQKASGGRHVPAAVSRAVWTRDGSQCAYVDVRGRRCDEKRGLELHHRKAYARGGTSRRATWSLGAERTTRSRRRTTSAASTWTRCAGCRKPTTHVTPGRRSDSHRERE